MRRGLSDVLDDDAELVERLAVLVSAGVAPATAWRAIADSGSSLAQAVTTVGPGQSAFALQDRLGDAAVTAGPGAQCLAAVWWVATESGAPLGAALVALADTLRDLAEGARERETALAGPRATSTIVLALPPLGVLFGSLVGLDSLPILVGTPLGWVCLALGAALVVLARRWSARMITRAALGREAPGLAVELVAIALGSGMPPERARRLAAAAMNRCALTDETALAAHHLAFAASAGVPAAPLLRAAGRAERRRSRAEAARRAQELGTRLVVPLGLCVLPAFILLGVVPVGVAIVSSTLAG